MKRILLPMFFLAAAWTACQDSTKLTVDDLKCEALVNPLAIDNTTPHFSWQMYSKQNGAAPSAYQILVATSPDKLNEEDADLWNTGKMNDANSINIPYGGRPLASRSQAWWKVRVWNQNDEPTAWSEAASFGVGLLDAADWSADACYIGVEQSDEKTQSAPLLRKRFDYEPSKAEGVFSSKFNYKGYRYLKLIGLKEALPLERITASKVRTDYSGHASFACSDEDMNAIYAMTQNTLEALSLGGYIVDCPQIERLGYGGDGNASAVTAQTFFNLAPLYMNWMQAWSDSQRPDGGMPHTAPNPYTAGGGPYWCGFIIPASWQTYVNYGDPRLMERYYPVMQRWLGYAESYQVDGLLKQWPNTEYRGWYLGDWVPPTGINPQDPRSIDLVNNCFLSECYGMMAKIAKVLGKDADISGYQQKQEALKTRIHEAFFDATNHRYASSSQIDLIYPMLAGVTPPSSLDAVKKALFEETAGRFRGHIATGLVGISILTQWGTQNQEADFVYGMLKKRTYPGYLYMIDHGATLTWEEWDGERSRLHNCYNAIGSWFIQALAGITPDESAPGYRHFYVRPQLVDGISWARASKDTPYGLLSVKWEQQNGSFTMEVDVPVGATATVCLPDGEEVLLSSGVHELKCRL